MEKRRDYSISDKSIRRAIALFLALFGMFSLLSPLTRHLFMLGRGLFWLGGLPLMWIALPLFIVFALITFKKGSYPSYGHRFNIGATLTILGISSIWSYVAFQHEDAFSFTTFETTFEAVKRSSDYFFASSIGGGVIGYLLSSLFGIGGAPLLYFLSILLLLSGIIIIFFPLEKKAYRAVRSHFSIYQSKRASEKEEARLRELEAMKKEREEAIRPIASETASPFIAPFLDHTQPSFGQKEVTASSLEEKETITAKRTELYHHDSDEYSSSQPVFGAVASYTNVPNSALLSTGLQEASYMPEAAILMPKETPSQAEKTIDTPLKKEERIPENHSNQTPETGSVEPITSPFLMEEPLKEETPSQHEAMPTIPLFMEDDLSSPQENSEEQKQPEVESTPKEAILPSQSEPSTPIAQPVPAPSFTEAREEAIEEVEEATPSVTTQHEPVPEEPVIAKKEAEIEISNHAAPLETTTPEPKQEIHQIEAETIEAKKEAPASKSDIDPLTGEKHASPLPNYVYPSDSLLNEPTNNDVFEDQKQECDQRMERINEIFTSFKSGARVVSYTIGPSVTRFNIETENGVTVSSINRYIQNIQVKLNGIPTRFEEVVPGQMTSGLEIANDVSRMVTMKEIYDALPAISEKTKLCIPFGQDIAGKFISGDLSKFPHMLVSGGTGSGKSVYMHSVIMSLIMRNRPEELKLVMVDPKRVEMSCYNNIPHLLCPIVKEMSQAKVCIDKLCHEMERRYSLFEKVGVREIREYNEQYADKNHLRRLPFIVCIIDEFADLMDTFKNVEEPVVRIAQKARAAGIHLIIATQRPTVNVVTGRLKANLSVRVALSMNSATDSVTILNQSGAEELAGHGDMLVICSEVLRNGLIRAQGAMVETSEIRKVTDFIRAQSKPQYDPYFLDLVDHEAEQKAAEEAALAAMPTRAELRQMAGDELYEQVKAKVMTQEYASLSRIQRENGIGFTRAGKLFSRLQQEGIVASAPETNSSSKGCKVLIHSAPTNDGLPSGSTDNSNISGGNYS